MRRVVEDLVRWHEQRAGVRSSADSDSYQRVQDRLHAIEVAQRLAATAVEPWFQTELRLMGPARGAARGRLTLRHPDCPASSVTFRVVDDRPGVRFNRVGPLTKSSQSSYEVTVDLRDQVPGRHEYAADVLAADDFRLRIWIVVEVT